MNIAITPSRRARMKHSLAIALKRAAAHTRPRRRMRDREALLVAQALIDLAPASARAAATGAPVEVKTDDPRLAAVYEHALRLSAARRPTDRLIRLRED